MSNDLANVPGAVVDERGLRHLGNPFAEQRALVSGQALALLDDRRVLTVEGEDRLSWLDSLASQALARLQPGESTEMLVLDPNGRIEHAASVVDDGTTTWLIVDAGDREGLSTWLTRMRFRLRVEVRDRSEEFCVVGGSPGALSAVTPTAPAAMPVVWHDPWPQVTAGGHGYALAEPHPGRERDWAEAVVTLDERARVIAAAEDGAIRLAGLDAVEALRIAAWRPRWASDVDERAIPHELDWMRTAVHLSKGCYRGQETVAKVHNLGHPPRRLVSLQLDGSGSVLPVRGDKVRAGESEVGTITSAAWHFEDGPIALALVRRNAPAGEDLVVDTVDGAVAAAQQIVVPAEAGATANVPRLPRLGRRPASS